MFGSILHHLSKIFCLLLFYTCIFADQANTAIEGDKIPGFSSWTMVLGYNGFRDHLAELGFGKFFQPDSSKRSHHGAWYGYYGGIELGKGSNGMLMGSKLTIWFSGGAGGITMGLTVCHHTDFERSLFVIRPEIGIGIGYVRIYYGYNAPVGGEDIVLDRHRMFVTFQLILIQNSNRTAD